MDDLIDRALNHKWWYSDTNLATLLIHELQRERDEHQAATTRHAILEKKLQQQEAEIERLNYLHSEQAKTIRELMPENERLRTACRDLYFDLEGDTQHFEAWLEGRKL